MFFFQVPAMLFALIPVIAIEAFAAFKIFRLTPRRALSGTAVANIVSTVVGVPLAWFALFALNLATDGGYRLIGFDTPWKRVLVTIVSMSWLAPYDDQLYWMVPLATTAFLIPTFFISVIAERLVLRRMWPDMDKHSVNRAAWMLNVFSYSFLLLLGLSWIAYAIITHKRA